MENVERMEYNLIKKRMLNYTPVGRRGIEGMKKKLINQE
jgi:hypothetical protein